MTRAVRACWMRAGLGCGVSVLLLAPVFRSTSACLLKQSFFYIPLGLLTKVVYTLPGLLTPDGPIVCPQLRMEVPTSDLFNLCKPFNQSHFSLVTQGPCLCLATLLTH